MAFTRASARWSSTWFGQTARTARTVSRTRTWHQAPRRSYASEGGHGSHQKSGLSGDLPWAIGSLVVTVPSVWYLAQPQIERLSGAKSSHGGHEHDGGEHDGHGVEPEDDEEGGEESNEKGGEEGNDAEVKEEDSGPDIRDEEDSKDDEEGADSDGSASEGGPESGPKTPADKGPDDVQHEKEGGRNVEGVQFKGATSATEEGAQGDTRKHIPDAKGGNKARIESHYGGMEGKATTPEQSPENEDLAAQSKQPGGWGQQSGKQAGISNTSTKHSTDIASNPDKSKKSTGGPETAKEMGTVDPRRPAAQQNET